jgi:hypothetical protein
MHDKNGNLSARGFILIGSILMFTGYWFYQHFAEQEQTGFVRSHPVAIAIYSLVGKVGLMILFELIGFTCIAMGIRKLFKRSNEPFERDLW